MSLDARLNFGPTSHATASAASWERFLSMASARRIAPEVFAPGALTVPDGGVVLRRQHNRALPIMRFVPELRGRELLIDAKLPNTTAGRDAASEVRSGLFRGLSVEFISKREENRGGLRTILSGELHGAGLVDDPSYSGSSVAVRQQGGRVARWR